MREVLKLEWESERKGSFRSKVNQQSGAPKEPDDCYFLVGEVMLFIHPAPARYSRTEQGGKKLDYLIECMTRTALEIFTRI